MVRRAKMNKKEIEKRIKQSSKYLIEKCKKSTWTLPISVAEEIVKYVEFGCYPGAFLRGILTKDLYKIVSYANTDNKAFIVDIYCCCYNYIPAKCWGTVKKVIDWSDLREKSGFVKVFEEELMINN